MFDPTSLTTLYAWLALGLVAILLGVGGLLLSRNKQPARPWVAPLLLAIVCGVVAGAVATESLAAGGPFALLAAFAVAMAFLRTAAPKTIGAFVLNQLGRPAVQSLALLLVGVGVLGWQSWHLTHSVESELAETDKHMALLGSSNLEAYGHFTSSTDEGSPVPLWQLPEGDGSDDEQAAYYLRRAKYDGKLIQTDGPDPRYNCHGWVFTGGRAWVRGSSVEQILRDNHYRRVDKPTPGDVAVFRDLAGDVMHTAIVRGNLGEDGLLLESKWGKLGRYIHTDRQHVYSAHACTYYTTSRGGHVLRTAKAD